MAGETHAVLRFVFTDETLARIEISRGRHGDLSVPEPTARRFLYWHAAQTGQLFVEPRDAVVGQTLEPHIGGTVDGIVEFFGVGPRPFRPKIE